MIGWTVVDRDGIGEGIIFPVFAFDLVLNLSLLLEFELRVS
jgi:hypothetical protein